MLTIERLQELGVNTKDGLSRCLGNATFYFRMIGMGLKNDAFEKLDKALADGNFDEALNTPTRLKASSAIWL